MQAERSCLQSTLQLDLLLLRPDRVRNWVTETRTPLPGQEPLQQAADIIGAIYMAH